MPRREGRFAQVSECAIRILSPAELRLYAAIRLHSSKNINRCFPRESQLAGIIGVSERAVRKLVRAIEKKGGLHHRRSGRLWRWYFPWEGTTISGVSEQVPHGPVRKGEQERDVPVEQVRQVPLPNVEQLPQHVDGKIIAKTALRLTDQRTEPPARTHQHKSARKTQDVEQTLKRTIKKFGRPRHA